MQEEVKPYDIDHLPELQQLAEEVQATKQPRRLRRRGDPVALLVPIPASARPRRRAAARSADNSLLRLIEIGNTAVVGPDEPTDVSANKHKYVADAYAGNVAPDDRRP